MLYLGLEKCERNVLPVLNNLLENREMSLDDGRFLMRYEAWGSCTNVSVANYALWCLCVKSYSLYGSATRYAELLKSEGREALDKLNIVPVSARFRVIALGLPTPTFTGHPLDPPLRSRFQARNVPPLAVDTLFALLTVRNSCHITRMLSVKAVNVLDHPNITRCDSLRLSRCHRSLHPLSTSMSCVS